MRKVGFTLVEVLVVIAIISLLVALVLPVLTSAREYANRAVCLSNLRNIAVGAFAYAQEYRAYIPITASQWDDDLRLFYPDYITELQMFVCPSTLNYVKERSHLRTNAPHGGKVRGTSYEYWAWCCGPVFMGGDYHRRKVSDSFPEHMTILADIDNRERNCILDPTDNHGIKGGNVLYLDLRAEWVEIPEGDTEKWWQVQAGFVDAYRHGGDGIEQK